MVKSGQAPLLIDSSTSDMHGTSQPNLAIVTSPIVDGGEVVEEARISVDDLRNMYQAQLGVDIYGVIPTGVSYVRRYRCVRSGFRFYHPEIVGDGEFYRQLQSHSWYYMRDKWEFVESLKHIPANGPASLLEVGCGAGEFLKRLREHNPGVSSVGLELNAAAAADARASGMDVRVVDVADHVRANAGMYDYVVAFQVLEHVVAPITFLRAAVEALRIGGTLMIAVPDNTHRSIQSLFVRDDVLLNMPPHHQGLWDGSSLSYLCRVLPLELKQLTTEPASAKHHSSAYRGLMKRNLIERFGRPLGYCLYAVGRPYYVHALTHLSAYLPAHTVLAVYQRTT